MQKVIMLMERAKNTAEMRSIENDKKMKQKEQYEAKRRAEQQELAMRVYNKREQSTIKMQKMVSRVAINSCSQTWLIS